jgi:hypothetical protein
MVGLTSISTAESRLLMIFGTQTLTCFLDLFVKKRDKFVVLQLLGLFFTFW